MGVGGENNGFGSHTCGGLFAFGNKERNDKRKARAGSRRPRRGVWELGTGNQRGGGVPREGVGGGSLREQWRNNVQIAVSDAPCAAQVPPGQPAAVYCDGRWLHYVPSPFTYRKSNAAHIGNLSAAQQTPTNIQLSNIREFGPDWTLTVSLDPGLV